VSGQEFDWGARQPEHNEASDVSSVVHRGWQAEPNNARGHSRPRRGPTATQAWLFSFSSRKARKDQCFKGHHVHWLDYRLWKNFEPRGGRRPGLPTCSSACAPKLIHNSFHKDWIVYLQWFCMDISYHLPFSSSHAQHNHINISNISRYYQSLLLYVTFMACFSLSCLGNPVENHFRILKVPKFAVHELKT
jgi:hypothetical protein